MHNFKEYPQYDALGLAKLIKNGDVSPEELLDTALHHASTLNPQLNAIIHDMSSHAREQLAAGLPYTDKNAPFYGVPFLIKDLLASYAGQPLRNGSAFFHKNIATHDSELVARFKRAGLVTFGKTNTPEFGITPFTEPKTFGPTHNPWNPAHTPGGSSGGSGAAVAARIVPMASGGDGGGSIRIPAACCGLFGLKPSRGRNPTGPDYGDIWGGAVAEHVLTRSVRDSAAMLDATAGADAGCPHFMPAPERPFLEEVTRDPDKLRVAFTDSNLLGTDIHPDCKTAVRNTATKLDALGHDVIEASPPFDRDAVADAFFTMICCETWADIASGAAAMHKKPRPQDFEPGTWIAAQTGKHISGGEYAMAHRTIATAVRKIGQFMQDFDILLTPTLGMPPFKIGALQPSPFEEKLLRFFARISATRIVRASGELEKNRDRIFNFIPYTPLANITGEPSMSVPLEWNADGLPIGTMFTAKLGAEATLFQLAGQLEAAHPWVNQSPSISAN